MIMLMGCMFVQATFTTFEQTMRALKIVKETQNIFEINTHSNIADSIEPS